LFGVEPGFPRKSDVILSIERLFPFPDFGLRVHADQLIVERCQVCKISKARC
jgi:hypothetical protein